MDTPKELIAKMVHEYSIDEDGGNPDNPNEPFGTHDDDCLACKFEVSLAAWEKLVAGTALDVAHDYNRRPDKLGWPTVESVLELAAKRAEK